MVFGLYRLACRAVNSPRGCIHRKGTAMTQQFGINSYSYIYSHTAVDALRHFASQEFRDVELMMYPGHAWPQQMDAIDRHAIKSTCETEGLRIRSLNMPNLDLNLTAANADMRTLTITQLRGVINLAGELGVPAVVVGPGKPNPLFPQSTEQLMPWFHAALDALIPTARAAGTRLIVENMPFAFLPRADQLMAALDAYGSDEIGVVYDVANAVFAREDPAAGLALVRNRLDLVHLSDTGLDVYRHDPVGKGVVDFAAFAAALSSIDYEGVSMLEIISTTPDQDIADSIAGLDASATWPVPA
jgi:sugar phosphate isomerase/epimerase